MSEQVWLALALARLAVRAELLEQENLALKLEAEKMKGNIAKTDEPAKETEDAGV